MWWRPAIDIQRETARVSSFPGDTWHQSDFSKTAVRRDSDIQSGAAPGGRPSFSRIRSSKKGLSYWVGDCAALLAAGGFSGRKANPSIRPAIWRSCLISSFCHFICRRAAKL